MKSLICLMALTLTGCANSSAVSGSDTTYLRNTQGQTLYRITAGNVYLPDGVRIAHIDSTGNIYNTSGVRVAKIGKK